MSNAAWVPSIFHGQVRTKHHGSKLGEFEFDEVYLILAYGENRLYLGEWAVDLEDGSLIEVTGSVKYINEFGQFFITGQLDHSNPTGFADPEWQEITIRELANAIDPGFIPGVNDPIFHGVPVMNMRCPVCRAEPGDFCSQVGYLVSHREGEPNCHQARWDRATDAEVFDRLSDAVAALSNQEVP